MPISRSRSHDRAPSKSRHLEEEIVALEDDERENAIAQITRITSELGKFYPPGNDIQRILDLSKAVDLPQRDLQVAIANGFAACCETLIKEDFSLAWPLELLARFGINTSHTQSQKIREQFLRGLTRSIALCAFSKDDGWGQDQARSISQLHDQLHLTHKEKEVIFRDAIIEKVRYGDAQSLQDTLQYFAIPKDILEAPEVINAAKEGVLKCLTGGYAKSAFQLFQLFSKNKSLLRQDPTLRDAARKFLDHEFTQLSAFENIKDILACFDVTASPRTVGAIYFDKTVPRAIREARETYPNHSHDSLHAIRPEFQRARITHALSPDEYARLVLRDPNLATAKNPREAAFDMLHDDIANADGENVHIAHAMQEFATIFGKETTMRFANRPDLSRHNIFLSASHLQEFAIGQGFDLEQDEQRTEFRKLFSAVLEQVARDDAEYEEGTAHDQFNRVLSTIQYHSIESILTRVADLNIPGLTKRIAHLQDGRFNPMTSWKGLKEVYALLRLTQKGELISALQASSAPESVNTYASALMEHPNVSLEALQFFLTDPYRFLESDAKYVDNALQRTLSPARMLDVERLGLQAQDVRDALADGVMDRLQTLPPYEITYFLNKNGDNLQTDEYLQQGFAKAIGRQREGIRGTAQQPKTVFAGLLRWAGIRGISKDDCLLWLRGEKDFDLKDSDRTDLAAILHAQGQGIPKPDGHHIRVRIGKKSDPSMIVAGNDTASCMPFGDGKTNVYTWNPLCAQLIVERETSEGEWRTMAQSVVMLDVDVSKPATDIITAMRNGQRITDLLPGKISAHPKMMCDNIEPAPNDIAAGRAGIIESAYTHFLHAYLIEHAAMIGVDASEVIIGKESYETKRPDWIFPQKPNTYLPLAPISYTDSAGPTVYHINTGIEQSPTRRTGISPVSAADILPMALLEGKGFADNPNLVLGLYDRQHKIVGASISRERHGDPNLSFMSRDDQGTPVGYILAYVDRTTDVPEVFIDDMAVDRSRNILAARHAANILNTFLEAYANHYQHSSQEFPAIYAQMRENTSYKLLMRQVQTLSQKHNLHVEISEEGETSLGGETFKLIRLFIGKTNAQIASAKERFHRRQQVSSWDSETQSSYRYQSEATDQNLEDDW